MLVVKFVVVPKIVVPGFVVPRMTVPLIVVPLTVVPGMTIELELVSAFALATDRADTENPPRPIVPAKNVETEFLSLTSILLGLPRYG